MSELKFKIDSAKRYREYLIQAVVEEQWEWCVFVGLWETGAWANHSNPNMMFRLSNERT